MYFPRVIESNLVKYLSAFPVLGLTGPRQSGKSTLLKHLFEDSYEYITFDDQSHQQDFYDDPKRFLKQHGNQVIFDEVQKIPELFHYIKIAVDEDRDHYGKFILTGSSQFSMLQKITESLAGRIGLLNLLPLQFCEMPKSLVEASVYQGSYPELVKRNYQYAKIWYDSYLNTYLEKDLRTLTEVGNIRDFNRLIQLLASQVSQTLNFSNFARDLGVTVPTVKRWISVLEASYIIFLLPPYVANHKKQITKSPKIYFYDTGLVAYLTKILTQDHFEKGPLKGPLFENYIVSEVKKNNFHRFLNHSVSFYRSKAGVEVDLIIETPEVKQFIEIKYNQTFHPKMLSGVKQLMRQEDEGYLVYCGQNRKFDDRIRVLNYQDFLQLLLR